MFRAIRGLRLRVRILQKVHASKLPPIPLSLASAARLITSIGTDVIELEEAFGISYDSYQRKASGLLTEYGKEEGKEEKEKCPVENCMQKYARHDNLVRHIRDSDGLGHLYAKSIIDEKACDQCHKRFRGSTSRIKHQQAAHNTGPIKHVTHHLTFLGVITREFR